MPESKPPNAPTRIGFASWHHIRSHIVYRSEEHPSRLGESVQPKLILVVDDEPAILMTAAAILEMQGYKTAKASDGVSALERALELRPDLVLSDVVMPRMNGVQLAIELKEKLPKTSVLLFSGNVATADILETARAQGHDFQILAKPVPMEELLSEVRNSLNRKAASAG